MSESILFSVKDVLGLAEDYTVFDQQVIMHINSALATLHQNGIGVIFSMATFCLSSSFLGSISDGIFAFSNAVFNAAA